MKEHWSIGSKKGSSLEEGLVSTEDIPYANNVKTSKTWTQLIQCVKLILYLELVLFIGWLCYSMWQTYHGESMQDKVMDNIGKLESQNLFEHSTYDKTTNSHDYSYQVDNILMKNLLLDDVVESKESVKMTTTESDNRESDLTATTVENNLQNTDENKRNDEEEKDEEQDKKEEEEEEKNEGHKEKYEEEEEKNEGYKEKYEEEEEKNKEQEEKNREQETEEEEEQKHDGQEESKNEEQEEQYKEQGENNEEREEKNGEQEGKYTEQGENNEEQEKKNEGQVKNEEEEQKHEEQEEREDEEQEETYEEYDETSDEVEKEKYEALRTSNLHTQESLRKWFIDWYGNTSDPWKKPEMIETESSVESPETQDYVRSSESEETESVREEKLENYLLFSLILENAMRDTEADEGVVASGHEWQDDTTASSERSVEESMNKNKESRTVVNVDRVDEKSEETSTTARSSGDDENVTVNPYIPADEPKEVESSMISNESTKVKENDEPDMQNPEEDYYNKQMEEEGETSEMSELESSDTNFEFDLSDYDIDRDFDLYSDHVNRELLRRYLSELRMLTMTTDLPLVCEDHQTYMRDLKSIYCYNRMRLRRGSNTESADTNQDHEEIHTNNREETSSDYIAPQLLKEKIENDAVSGSVHRVTRHISKNLINEDTSVDTNDMRFVPEWHNVNDKEEYSDSNKILDVKLDEFSKHMMVIAHHIDELQNRLLRYNNLTDDYVSKEISS